MNKSDLIANMEVGEVIALFEDPEFVKEFAAIKDDQDLDNISEHIRLIIAEKRLGE